MSSFMDELFRDLTEREKAIIQKRVRKQQLMLATIAFLLLGLIVGSYVMTWYWGYSVGVEAIKHM